MDKNEKLRLDNIILKNYKDFSKAYNKQFTNLPKNFTYFYTVYWYRNIINLALANSPKKVIDLGCGSSVMIRSLSEFAPEVECFACDIMDKHTNFGASCTKNVHFFTIDIVDGVPFVPESVDTAISLEVLEHLDEPQKLFSEVTRILKPGGRLIISTPSTDSIAYHVLRMMREDIRKPWLKGYEHQHPEFCTQEHQSPGVHRVEGFSKKELKALGKKAGFKMLSISSHSPPFPNSLLYEKMPIKLLKWVIEHHSMMFGLLDYVSVFKL